MIIQVTTRAHGVEKTVPNERGRTSLAMWKKNKNKKITANETDHQSIERVVGIIIPGVVIIVRPGVFHRGWPRMNE